MDDAINHLQSHDSVLAELIGKYPKPSFVAHKNYYHELTSSIISQQLSVKAAQAIEQRFKALFNNTFPEPEEILAADEDALRAAGLSRPKIRYIKDLAQKITDKDVRFDAIEQLSNEQIVQELTAVKGIGEWTVHMFLMFCMARLDVLPTGDLGIRNGVARLYGIPTIASPDEVREVAEKNNWRPYESVASWYVWQSLENVPINAS